MKLSACFASLFIIASSSASQDSEGATQSFDTKALRGRKLNQGQGQERKTYIVTFAEGHGSSKEKAHGLANVMGGSVDFVYSKVLNGAALTVPAAAAEALAKSVETIEEDGEVYASEMHMKPVMSWGQDRIDQCPTLTSDNSQFMKAMVPDVKVYVIDTGIYSSHQDFSGGMINSKDSCHGSFVRGKDLSLNDANGHGTHVASTICGNDYGLIECGTGNLCGVAVLDRRGSGSYSGVIAGIEHVAQDCNGGMCVANMSLGGGRSNAVNAAVEAAVNAGVVMVVAAGNESTDACTKSPASTASAITVGATEKYDTLAYYTNRGSCVDIFAPGTSIKAAWTGSNTGTRVISGTSMASPHAAALAAKALQNGTPANQVASVLKADATLMNVDCAHPGTGIATIGGLGCGATTNTC